MWKLQIFKARVDIQSDQNSSIMKGKLALENAATLIIKGTTKVLKEIICQEPFHDKAGLSDEIHLG